MVTLDDRGYLTRSRIDEWGHQVVDYTVTGVGRPIFPAPTTLVETLTLLDDMDNFGILKTIEAILRVVDTTKRVGKTYLVDEIASLIDTIVPVKMLEELLILSDGIPVGGIRKNVIDTLRFVDGKTKNVVRTITDVFQAIDGWSIGQGRYVFVESLVVVDSVPTVKGRSILVNEIVDFVDNLPNLGRVYNLLERLVVRDQSTIMKGLYNRGEIVTTDDVVINRPILPIVETLVLVDVTPTWVVDRLVIETVEMMDVCNKVFELILDETTGVVDGLVNRPIVTVEELLTMVESFWRPFILVETLAVADSIINRLMVIKSERSHLSDGVTKTPGRELSEISVVGDTLVKRPVPIMVEVLSFIDTMGNVLFLLESLLVSDTMLKGSKRVLVDVANMVDGIRKTPGKIVEESIRVVETVKMAAETILEEVIGLSDLFTTGWLIIFMEYVGLDDTTERSMLRVVNDHFHMVDRVTKKPGVVVTEILAMVDSVLTSWAVVLVETLTMADGVIKDIGITFHERIDTLDGIVSRVVGRVFQDGFNLVDKYKRSTQLVVKRAQAYVSDLTQRTRVKSVTQRTLTSETVSQTRTDFTEDDNV